MRLTRNEGSDIPIKENIRLILSITPSFRYAHKTPKGTDTMMHTNIEANARLAVGPAFFVSS